MPRHPRLRRAAAILLAAAVLTPVAALVRARFLLPEAEVPVLRYARIAETADDADTVSLADFFSQLEDLLDGGYESVTPHQLRQYAVWGRRLPPRPFLITIDEPSATLPTGGIPMPQDNFSLTRIPGTAEDILRFFGYTALVAAEPAADPAPGMVSRKEAAAAEARGWLAFLPDSGIGFSGGEGVARIGPRTDFSALPRLRVVGGRHRFLARIAQDAVVPENFGTLRLDHVAGPTLPLAVLAYLDDHSPPFARGESDGLAEGGTLAIPLGKDVTFPVEVVVYDPERLVLYYRQKVQRSDVTRPAGWHLPLSGPEEGVPLDLDPPPDPEPEPEPAEDADFELDLGPDPDAGFSDDPPTADL
jgi:hypothetical protein